MAKTGKFYSAPMSASGQHLNVYFLDQTTIGLNKLPKNLDWVVMSGEIPEDALELSDRLTWVSIDTETPTSRISYTLDVMALVGESMGKEACNKVAAFVYGHMHMSPEDTETRIYYGSTGLFNTPASMVWNQEAKHWRGDFRTKLGAAIWSLASEQPAPDLIPEPEPEPERGPECIRFLNDIYHPLTGANIVYADEIYISTSRRGTMLVDQLNDLFDEDKWHEWVIFGTWTEGV